jgi:hypothetical protein
MIAKKKGQRLVLLPIIERHSLLAVRSRFLWIADPERSWTHCVVSLEQERPIVQTLGYGEKFVGNRTSHSIDKQGQPSGNVSQYCNAGRMSLMSHRSFCA